MLRRSFLTDDEKGKFYDVKGETLPRIIAKPGMLMANSPFHYFWARRARDSEPRGLTPKGRVEWASSACAAPGGGCGEGARLGRVKESAFPNAPVAQLDRASGYEPEGRVFESPRAHHGRLRPLP